MYELRLRRYCSSGEPGANGGDCASSAGSESSWPGWPRFGRLSPFQALPTIANAAAMYEPPETAAR